MDEVKKYTLFVSEPKRFERIKDYARSFAAVYAGNSIIRELISCVAYNYARKKGFDLQIFMYPFDNEGIWAFTFVKLGMVFMCVNTNMPLCKQNFAIAHELYHVYCYGEEMGTSLLEGGSVLNSQIATEFAATQEDLEANAFAGLLLMPDRYVDEQMDIYGLDADDLIVDDILLLMDIFALPYKAVVFRLEEVGKITADKVSELLSVSVDEIQKRASLLGRAVKWIKPSGLVQLGTLEDDLDFNITHEILSDQRSTQDSKCIEKIKKRMLDYSLV